jgi:hypothetical protein
MSDTFRDLDNNKQRQERELDRAFARLERLRLKQLVRRMRTKDQMPEQHITFMRDQKKR